VTVNYVIEKIMKKKKDDYTTLKGLKLKP